MSRGTFRRQIASSEGSRDEEGASGEASEDGEEAGTAGPRGEGEGLCDGATGGVKPLRQQPRLPGWQEEQGRPLLTQEQDLQIALGPLQAQHLSDAIIIIIIVIIIIIIVIIIITQ